MKRISPDTRTEAVRLYLDGLPLSLVSQQTGISRGHLKTIITQAGVPKRPQGFVHGNGLAALRERGPAERAQISGKHKANGHRPDPESAELGRTRSIVTRHAARDAIRTMLISYRNGAVKRGLTFTLSRDIFEQLINQDCSYCGQIPETREVAPGLHLVCNGIDRENNTLGYMPTNCRTACKVCNIMKGRHSLDFFIAHCRRIVVRND